VLGTATADASGNVSSSITIPALTAPGMHSIIGVGNTSNISFSTPVKLDTSWSQFGFDYAHHRQNYSEHLRLMLIMLQPGHSSGHMPSLIRDLMMIQVQVSQYQMAWSMQTARSVVTMPLMRTLERYHGQRHLDHSTTEMYPVNLLTIMVY
jgi:hypothetical protein